MTASVQRGADGSGERPASDPRAYLRIVWRWKLLLLAILVTIPLATYLVTRSQPKVFQSSTLMQIQSAQVDTSLFPNSSASIAPTVADDASVAARLITTTRVARAAALILGEPASSARSLLNHVTAAGDTSGFVTITATDSSPTHAAAIANGFATAVVNLRAAAAIHQLDLSIAQLVRQLTGLSDKDPGRLQLSDQLQRFRALRAAQGSNAQTVEPAAPSSSPISPRVGHSVILAAIVALLLGFGAVAAAESLDRRIRSPEELERLTGLPMLSAIPASSFNSGPLSAVDHEAFYTLRAALTYFNIDRRISSVLITSAAKGDGKTTVATNLGIAMARAGKDVIVLDADLRRSTASVRLGVGTPPLGLGAVLVEELPLAYALVDVDTPVTADGRLRILPAGPPPPNPSELIGSQRMRELIAELTEQSDIVIVDSTPVLTVSDSLPLMNVVSGLVMVARMGVTSRDALARLQSVIESAGGSTLGVVATGTSASGLYSGYGYSGSDMSPNGSAEVIPAATESRWGRRRQRAAAASDREA